MHLIPCSPPVGAVESAPATSLGVGERAPGDHWDGFWHLPDERYYTRQTLADGTIRWYRFADEGTLSRHAREARVLPLRRHGMIAFRTRYTMMVGTRRGARMMLVGASRRRLSPPRDGQRSER